MRQLLTRPLRYAPRGSVVSAVAARGAQPTWLDSFIFVALMSGPPKFRDRDVMASLQGAIDSVVVLHIVVWLCGALWVVARLYPAAVRRGSIPRLNPAQAIAALLIGALTLSLWQSPGFLLTAFTLGQFAVMLSFIWVFTHRFGARACLRLMFIGVAILAVTLVVLFVVAPGMVVYGQTDIVLGVTRVQGELIADTGSLAVIGLVLTLSNTPALRVPVFWAAFSVFGALLAASRTRNAYVAFIGFVLIGFVYGRRLPVRKLFLLVVIIALSVALADVLSPTVDYLVRERDSIDTMSDRVPLWEHVTAVVMRESPLIGMGYYAASRIVAPQYNPGLGNTHSTFFEILVGGGIIGAVLYVLLCAILVWFAVRLLLLAPGEPMAVATAGLLFVALAMGITTPASVQPGPLGFAFWSTTALLPRLWREAYATRGGGRQLRFVPSVARSVGAGRLTAMNRHVR